MRNIISVFLFFDLLGMKKETVRKSAYNRVAEYIYSVFSYLLLCMTVIFIAFTFFLRLVTVSGASMNPTLRTGDGIIISNFMYTPDYGDIVAVNKESAGESSMIKRVVALPGDEVTINFESHIITVNGKVAFEDYEVMEPISEAFDMDYPVSTFTVPDDSIFVLGDNRNNSIDSRSESVGVIKLDEINGKALFRLFPIGQINIY